ncbi:helix-turn-helix transcriptional regulator [Planctomonas sp. JC2975]|uniref:ArsR/SmtB family transcription factor n=1 Tax=Planctomonas sp. JC2975 TaxID=2729626 RepID=UPI0014750872|nr:helix-turn-helix domain-containing protein [Planctomonas sp. JC2975]NNC10835.1 helix-turn-helix transcriptional regulator [Planctomonas sp. JC2975]
MSTDDEQAPAENPRFRRLDASALKALAHPLRMQIFEELVQFGPLTATGLGERLGESSGSMSYHLRELAKHGFVREVEGKGTARERWWERTPGAVSLRSSDDQSESENAAADLIAKTWHHRWFEQTMQFIDQADNTIPRRWVEASTISHTSLPLTIEQLEELKTELDALFLRLGDRYRGQEADGTRRVQIQFNIYPLTDPKGTSS